MEQEKRQCIAQEKEEKSQFIAQTLQRIDAERQKRKDKRNKTISRPVSVISEGFIQLKPTTLLDDPQLLKLKQVLENKRKARLAVLTQKSRKLPSSFPEKYKSVKPITSTIKNNEHNWEELIQAQKDYEQRKSLQIYL
jgi:hypothetical protein